MKRSRLFIGIAFVITAILVTYALSSAQALVGPITFDLEEQNASGESGTVTLTDLGGGKTLVQVTVSGQPSESSQPMQVHEGQCGPTLARIVHPLNDLRGGTSTTTINVSLGALTADNSRFAINSHKSEPEYTVYVLCGNIPSLAEVAQLATATQQALEALQTRPPGGIAPVTFDLVAENDSGQSGKVTLTDLGGGKTMVQVSVTGEPEGAIQPLHIHEGQCGPTLARLAFNLQDLVDGKSSTTIDASLDSLTTEGFAFAINSHKSYKEYTIYVLCGNIPSVAQMAATGAAPTPPGAVTTATGPTAPAATAVPPTATAVPPTATAVPPTATTVPPTATAIPPTATAVPPTATAVPPTATAVPPTATAVPPTATVAPPTVTTVAQTAATVAPTKAAAAPTSESAGATAVAPVTKVAQPTAAAPTSQAEQATAAAPTTQAAQPTAAAPTSQAEQATAAAPATQAAQPTAVAPTSVATATTTPDSTIPETGGNPYSGSFLGLTILGILIIAAGLMLMQVGERGSWRI
ncbi:MAG: hypothetical protein IT331_17285 [Anaerolineae bacterium]|nr:hypothetical protein [Anaerolineae bacterium]